MSHLINLKKASMKLLIALLMRTKVVQNMQDSILILMHKNQSKDDIITLKNGTKLCLPLCQTDYIQRIIMSRKDYYEIDLLHKIDRYIPENATLLDIGANIGNYSIYWAVEKSAQMIYAFEPIKNTYDMLIKNTYDMLIKNIEIKQLANIIHPFNAAFQIKTAKIK